MTATEYSIHGKTHARPMVVTIAAILIGLNVYRVLALGLAISAATGGFPSVYIIPGFGDFLAGITAPIIAVGLWRGRNLTPWLLALIWLPLSIADLIIGQTLPYLVPFSKGGGLPSGGNTLAIVGLFLLSFLSPGLGGNLASIVLLTLRRSRNHFLLKSSSDVGNIRHDVP